MGASMPDKSLCLQTVYRIKVLVCQRKISIKIRLYIMAISMSDYWRLPIGAGQVDSWPIAVYNFELMSVNFLLDFQRRRRDENVQR